MVTRFFLWLALASLAGAAGHQHGAARAGIHSLDVFADGRERLHLLLADYREGKPVLVHQRSEDAGATWSEPVRVDAGLPPAHAPHRGMDAQVAAIGERLVAVWMTAGTDAFGGGPMQTALSDDGGKTWRRGPNPADDGSTEGHGFLDLAAVPVAQGRTFDVVWLDTRAGKRGLRHARSEDAGATWSANHTVAAETCECCPNTLVNAGGLQLGVLFRGKGPRDMAFAQSHDGGRAWQTAVPAGEFGWKFDGCPHVGGGLATLGTGRKTEWHAAVWSGQPETAGVHHVSSVDLGRTWTVGARLGSDGASHPDIAVDDANGACAVWDDGGVVTGAHRWPGKPWIPFLPRLSSEGAKASHPRVIATATGFRIFWTEERPGESAVWNSSAMELPSAPLPE